MVLDNFSTIFVDKCPICLPIQNYIYTKEAKEQIEKWDTQDENSLQWRLETQDCGDACERVHDKSF